MFKIESYIGPLLLGYLSKYVKLRQEDFQLSLWGGDAVFHHVKLQYDILEDLIPLPLGFKSGQVHELRVHVPWTKLGSESVVITLNTVECVLSLKSPSDVKTESSTSEIVDGDSPSNSPKQNKSVAKSRRSPTSDSDVPPGYLQSYLNRIINNIHIVVNNLILKFVEDDIVVSMNVKSLEIFSTDSDWMKSFIEITQQSLRLHKIISVTDMTVCLDKMNASGHIDSYQHPVLYRCGLSCRIEFQYNNIYSTSPNVLKMHLHFIKLEVSLTDSQLPMFSRLMELALALYYGTLDFSLIAPIASAQSDTQSTSGREEVSSPASKNLSASRSSERLKEYDKNFDDSDNENNQSWASWAWSYVPQIIEEDGENEAKNNDSSNKLQPLLFMFGIFVEKATLEFKLTTKSNSGSGRRSYSRRVNISPVCQMDFEGMGVHVFCHGQFFFAAQAGCTRATLCRLDRCTCGHEDTSISNQTYNNMVTIGLGHQPDASVNYLTGSLFAVSPIEPGSDTCLSREAYLGVYTESFIWKKYGAFWFDYLYTLDVVKEDLSVSDIVFTELTETDGIRENSLKRMFIGRTEIYLSPSLTHRMEKFISCLHHNYEPYTKVKPEVNSDEPLVDEEIVDFHRPHPSEDQLARLHEYIPTRSFFVLLLKPTIKFYPLDHQFFIRQPASPYLQAQCERVEIQLDVPMYPRHLVRQISRLLCPSELFLAHCYQSLNLRLAGLCASLIVPDTVSSAIATQSRKGQPLPPGSTPPNISYNTCPLLCPGEYVMNRKTLLLPMYWISTNLAHDEMSLEAPSVSLTLSQPQLYLAYMIGVTWSNPDRYLLSGEVLQTVIRDSHNYNSPNSPAILDLTSSDISARYTRTHACTALEMNAMGPIECALVYLNSGRIVPVLDTASPPSQQQESRPITSNKSTSTPTRPLPGKVTSTGEIKKIPVFRLAYQTPNDFDSLTAPFLCHVFLNSFYMVTSEELLLWLTYKPVSDSLLSSAKPATPLITPANTIDSGLQSATNTTQPIYVNVSRHSKPAGTADTRPHTRTNSRGTKTCSSKVTGAQNTCQATVTKLTVWNTLKVWFSQNYSRLQRLDLQVHARPSIIYVQRESLYCQEFDGSIHNLIYRSLQTGGNSLFEVCLPEISLLNHATKSFQPVDELPLRNIPSSDTCSLRSDRLPWRLVVENLGCMWLSGSGGPAKRVINPITMTFTIATTAKFKSPVLLDELTSLAWCLHCDLPQLTVALTHTQLAQAIDIVFRCTQAIIDWAYHARILSSRALTERPPKSHHLSPVTPLLVNASSEISSQITGRSTGRSALLATSATDLKLTLWLQWTLAQCQCHLMLNKTRQLRLILHDLTTFVDVQERHSQFKAKLRSMTCKKVALRPNGHLSTMTLIGPEGKHLRPINTQDGEYTESMERSTREDKTISDSNTASKETPIHFAVSFVFTRASTTDARRKYGQKKQPQQDLILTSMESIVDISSTASHKDSITASMATEDDTVAFPTAEYLNELSLSLEPLDIVLNYELVHEISSFIESLHVEDLVRLANAKQVLVNETPTPLLCSKPWFVSSEAPLVYIDLKSVRVFAPILLDSLATSRNTLVLSWSNLTLSPFSRNPLQRLVVDPENYQLAAETGALSRLGSCVEDRQYQLDWHCVSISAAEWKNLLIFKSVGGYMETKIPSSADWTGDEFPSLESVGVADTSSSFGRQTQNPALDWNECSHPFDESSILVKPLLKTMDLSVTFAPAIYATNLMKSTDNILCGYSLEVNVISDIVWLIDIDDIRLMGTTLSYLRTHGLPHLQQTETIPEETHSSGYRSEYTPTTKVTVTKPSSGKDTSGSAKPPSYAEDDCKSLSQIVGLKVTPFSILLTAGKISVVLYSSRDAADSTIAEKSSQVEVCLHAVINQPYTVVSMTPSEECLKFSSFDVKLSLADKTRQQFVPESKLISAENLDNLVPLVPVIDTRPGTPNPKTGVPPSIYTLTLKNFFHSPGVLRVLLERPVYFTCSPGLVQTGIYLTKEFTDIVVNCFGFSSSNSSPSSQQSSEGKVAEAALKNPIFLLLYSASFHTGELRVSLQSDKGDSIDMQTSQIVLEVELGCKPDLGTLAIQVFYSVENVSVLTKLVTMGSKFHNLERLLVSPFGFDGHVHENGFAVGTDYQSTRIAIKVRLDLVKTYIGQETILVATNISTNFVALIPKDNTPKDSPDLPSTSDRKCDSQTSRRVVEYKDDIRAERGRFRLLHKLDSSSSPDERHEIDGWCLPQEYEMLVLNSNESEDGEGVSGLSWCYPEPRVITHLHLMPVPFVFVEVAAKSPINAKLKVPCQLQYFDSLSKDFVTYVLFGLSENEPQTVPLPDTWHKDAVAAHVWRVVIDCFARLELTAEHNMDEPPEVSMVHVSPLTLAACMRVDSLYSPELVPLFIAQVNSDGLHAHLLHHPQTQGCEDIRYVAPFTLSPSYLSSHSADEMARIKMTGLSLQLTQSLSSCRHLQLHVNSLDVGLTNQEVLVLETFLAPSSVSLEATVPAGSQERTLVTVETSPVHLKLSRTVIQTLSLLVEIYGGSDCAVLSGCYLICNNTPLPLHLQQCGVKHETASHFPSGECQPWFWQVPLTTTTKTGWEDEAPHQLRVTVGAGFATGLIRWSPSFVLANLRAGLHHPASVGHPEDSASSCTLDWAGLDTEPPLTMIVTTHRISNTLTKVVFHGTCIIRNGIDLDLDVCFLDHSYSKISSKAGVVASSIDTCIEKVSAKTASRGFLVSPHQISIRASSPKPMGLPWSDVIQLSLPDSTNQQPESNSHIQRSIIKLLLSTSEYGDATAVVHIICTTEWKAISSSNDCMQVLTFSPMLIVENLMTNQVTLTLTSSTSGLQSELNVMSKGGREQGSMLNREATIVVTAHLSSGEVNLLDPPLELNKEKILSLLTKNDIKTHQQPSMNNDWITGDLLFWPETSPTLQSQSLWSTLHRDHPSLPARLTGLSCMRDSVLLSIAPWLVIINRTQLDLVIKQGETVYNLSKEDYFIPPACKEVARLGCDLEGDIRWSQCFILSLEDDMTSSSSVHDISNGVLSLGSHARMMLSSASYLIFLTLDYVREDGMTQLIVQTAFKVFNRLSRTLLIKPMFVLENAHPVRDCPLNSFETSPSSVGTFQTSLMLAECDVFVCPKHTPSSGASSVRSNRPTELCLWSATCPIVKEQLSAPPSPSHSPHKTSAHLQPALSSGSLHLLFMLEKSGLQWSLPVKIQNVEEDCASPATDDREEEDSQQEEEGHRRSPSSFVMRRLISLPYWRSDKELSQIAVSMSVVSQRGVLYIELSEDPQPDMIVHNLSLWDLFFGEAGGWESTAMLREQECNEAGVLDLPLVRRGACLAYTPPAREATYPSDKEGEPSWWRLRFGRVCRGKRETDEMDEVDEDVEASGLHMQWSEEVDLWPDNMDYFVRIGEDCLLWVHTRPSSSSNTIIVTLQRDSRSITLVRNVQQQLARLEDRRDSDTLDHLVDLTVDKTLMDDSPPPTMRMMTLQVKIPLVYVSLMDRTFPLRLAEFTRLTFAQVELCADTRASCEDDFVLVMAGGVEQQDPTLSSQVRLSASCYNVQLDNQFYEKGLYDFAVVLRRKPSSNPEGRFSVVVQLGYPSNGRDPLVLRTVEACLQPLEAFIEDKFVYDLVYLLDTYLPLVWSSGQHSKFDHLPAEVAAQLKANKPVRLGALRINPIELTLTVHASLKIFLSSDCTPLNFSGFNRIRLFTNAGQISHALSMHYITGALFRAGWVLGSLELLGNPGGLLRQLGSGVADLVRLPYQGLSYRPGSLLTGVTAGLSSLLRHTTGGFLGSLTSLSSSVARNLDYMAMDQDHQLRQSAYRHNHPTGLSQGFTQGLSGFGISLLGAVAGIADQPLQALQSPGQLSTSGRALAVASGVCRGLIGAVTKPLSGAAELIAQTGQGFLVGTGISSLPQAEGVQWLENLAQANQAPSFLAAGVSGEMTISRILATLQQHLSRPLLSGGLMFWVNSAYLLGSPTPPHDPMLAEAQGDLQRYYLVLTATSFLAWCPGLAVDIRPLAQISLDGLSRPSDGVICAVRITIEPVTSSQQLSCTDSRIADFIQGVHEEPSATCETRLQHPLHTLPSPSIESLGSTAGEDLAGRASDGSGGSLTSAAEIGVGGDFRRDVGLPPCHSSDSTPSPTVTPIYAMLPEECASLLRAFHWLKSRAHDH